MLKYIYPPSLPSLINIWTQQWCNIKRYCYASVVCWGIRVHQNTQAPKTWNKDVIQWEFPNGLFWTRQHSRKQRRSLRLWVRCCGVWQIMYDVTQSASPQPRTAPDAVSLWVCSAMATARLWKTNEMLVSCQNVITCHRCIGVAEHLDLRFRGLIPVCLVAMIWRFSVTMTTASPVRAWCSTGNCHSGDFIFPWPPNKWRRIIFILNETQCLVRFKAKAFVFLIKVNLHLISLFLCKYKQMSALLVCRV